MSSVDDTTAVADEVEAAPPTDEARQALLARLSDELGDAIVGSHIAVGHELWVRVATDAWFEAGRVARHELGFGFFDFLSAIDWLPSPYGRDMDAEQDTLVHGAEARETPPLETGVAGGDTRFQVLARVHSVTEHVGLLLKVDVDGDPPAVQSWVGNYSGADWHEREAWEMFGIDFIGHPGLRHLYLPGQFEGNPLRKDFPLLARRVKPWPGIVDVEGMPGGDDDEADDEGETGDEDGAS